MTDARDLALSALADDVAQLEESVARYRLLAVAAIELLAVRDRELEGLRQQHRRLIDEFRTLRSQLMGTAA